MASTTTLLNPSSTTTAVSRMTTRIPTASIITTSGPPFSFSTTSFTADNWAPIIGNEEYVRMIIPKGSPCDDIPVSWNGTSPYTLSLFTSNTTIDFNSAVPFARFNISRNTYSLPGSLVPAYQWLGASVRDSNNEYHDIQYRQNFVVFCPQASGIMNQGFNNNGIYGPSTSGPTAGLSSSSIKGIIIGVIAFVVLFVIFTLVILSRHKRKRRNREGYREPPSYAFYRTLGRPSSRSTLTTTFGSSSAGRRSVEEHQDTQSEKTPSTRESAVMSEIDMDEIFERNRAESRPTSRARPAPPSNAQRSSVGWDPRHPRRTSQISEESPFDDRHSVGTVRPSQAASRRTLSQRTVDRAVAAALRSSSGPGEKGRSIADVLDDASSELTRSDSDGSAVPLSRQELEALADIVAARLNNRMNVTTRSTGSRSRSSHGSDLPPQYA
ncbi:hypothetical protein FRC17_006547 [Serendipita sp. 399]|nr:hypothetical protein FRC17_006547 [Serendipita sp. 399]